MKYWDMQRMFASAETARHSFGDISRYSTKPLPDAVVAKVADLLAKCPSTDPGLEWLDVVAGLGRGPGHATPSGVATPRTYIATR